ncbi:HNH endonuclease [Sphingomonas abaci]|uniref:5-methylcytosine-specific restriction protein A n=1 Tax=Sphingomonas abaci TaxID=237611 RepID=A0A7W7AKZ7_9SPHN|nr:HNH endonuclease signature motif containing protein [Sphingomonas abaci]MBB4618973.1 5-methylcytosine-specific restriction protein A [Sphingomonas abaci]
MVQRLRGRAGQAQRARRLARTDGLCERCDADDRVTLATVVDHIVPLAKGGTDEDDNTRNLCDPCHREVTAEQFGHARQVALGACDVNGWPTDPRHPWNASSGDPLGVGGGKKSGG